MGESAARRVPRRPVLLASALVPLLLIAALAAVFVATDPISSITEVPPVEALAVERTELREGGIELRVRNDGPDPVTIAQVLVNDAYWSFSTSHRTLGRLEAATIEIDYPWDAGLPLGIGIVTSSGAVIEHDIEVATETPTNDARTLGIYALLGLYVGVIPVAIGLLWFDALARAPRRWVAFFLAFTVGLLAFLLVDTVEEGFELAGEAGAALNATSLFVIGALCAVTLLAFVSAWAEGRGRGSRGLVLGYLIAAGIGLHNLGEGLAVGAAVAAGEVALGTFLVLGFALHNTTEGLAIVSPLAQEERRPSLWHLVALGAVAGVPTIFGAWLGGYAFTPSWAALAFGIAAGAIAQVIWAIYTSAGRRELAGGHGALGFALGLVVMYLTGLLTV